MKVEFDSFPCAHKVYYVFCLQQKLLDSNFFSPQGKFFLCILGNSFYIMLEALLFIWKAWLHEISNNVVTMPITSCSSCISQNDSCFQNCCKQDTNITQQLAYRACWKFLRKYEINFLPPSPLLTFLEKNLRCDDLESKLKFVCVGIVCVGSCYWISSVIILNSLNFCLMYCYTQSSNRKLVR